MNEFNIMYNGLESSKQLVELAREPTSSSVRRYLQSIKTIIQSKNTKEAVTTERRYTKRERHAQHRFTFNSLQRTYEKDEPNFMDTPKRNDLASSFESTKREYDTLDKRHSWEWVQRSNDILVFHISFELRLERDADGSLCWYKVQHVAYGNKKHGYTDDVCLLRILKSQTDNLSSDAERLL